MFKLRKEKIEKIKNVIYVLLQLSSNINRMTGEIERQRLQSEKATSCNSTLVTFRLVRLNSCTPRQLGFTHTHNFIHQSMADTKYRYVLEKKTNIYIYKQKINRCKVILTTIN